MSSNALVFQNVYLMVLGEAIAYSLEFKFGNFKMEKEGDFNTLHLYVPLVMKQRMP